jgi:ppGpp synthetase/RelA/SpoT-type nucleotidyltranferase
VLSQEVFASLKKSIEDKVQNLESSFQTSYAGMEKRLEEKDEEVTALQRDLEEEKQLSCPEGG